MLKKVDSMNNNKIIKKWIEEKAKPDLKKFFKEHNNANIRDATIKGFNETKAEILVMLNEARADERNRIGIIINRGILHSKEKELDDVINYLKKES